MNDIKYFNKLALRMFQEEGNAFLGLKDRHYAFELKSQVDTSDSKNSTGQL